jgi:putative ABC transport system permease protein
VASDIRRMVRDIDPRLSVVQTAALEQLIDQKLGREVLAADLAGFFAGLTLLLVILGVYGTVTYSVARRTKEIGIRIALGARPSSIGRIILRQLALAIAIGMAVGIAAAIAVGRVLAFLLFGLKPADALTIGGAWLIVCVAALIASYLPVRRAWRLDPTIALRLE